MSILDVLPHEFVEIDWRTLRFEKEPGKFLLHCIKMMWDVHENSKYQNLIVMPKSYYSRLIQNQK